MKFILTIMTALFISSLASADFQSENDTMTFHHNVAVGYGATQNDAYTNARRAANWECSPGVVRNIRVRYSTAQNMVKATMTFNCFSGPR